MKRQLGTKLKPSKKGIKGKNPNCGKDDCREKIETKEEYLSIPWQNYVKKLMVEALITENQDYVIKTGKY